MSLNTEAALITQLARANGEAQRLRTGIETLLRIAEYRDSMSVSTDSEGRPYRHPIPQEDLRALLEEDE